MSEQEKPSEEVGQFFEKEVSVVKKETTEGVAFAEQCLTSEFRERLEADMRRSFRYWRRVSGKPEEMEKEDEEDLHEAIETELKFSRAVLTAYERWRGEKDSVVLWDIDDTLGKNQFLVAIPECVSRWGFRASILLLFAFLREQAPEVKNGIVTDRLIAREQLTDPEQLGHVSSFFDSEQVYSSHGFTEDYCLEHGGDVEEVLEERFRERGLMSTRSATDKALLLERLRSDGMNVKIIDDMSVAALEEKNGVWVYHCMPDSKFIFPSALIRENKEANG
ncbi:MAG: hypothetical protein NUV54_02600 [Candidatus Taylorbacteria bacterium]|nr:hypothetical protein [Candidatus Taylorbacteria bacterium]